MSEEIERRLARLERRSRMWRLWALASATGLLGLAVVGVGPGAQEAGVMRARGLILLDEAGRERIALGAPLPDLADRRLPGAANGVLIMDEHGFDRVVLGAPTPDPAVAGERGPRISPQVGLQWNDPAGNERGGIGYLENGRVTMGLDRESGEGVALFILENGAAGLVINGEEGRQWILLAANPNDPSGGLLIRDIAGRERVRIGVGADGQASVRVLDENGAVIGR